MGGEGLIPMRPLTLGELLDAAVALLRRYALGLIGTGLVLAAVEQALLYPLRQVALSDPPSYLPPRWDHLGAYWLLVALGLGTETLIVTLLGGLVGRAALAALLGPERAPLYRGLRIGPLIRLALISGLIAAVAAAGGLVPWIIWYLFVGLAGPAVSVDWRAPAAPGARSTALGAFGALGRSMVLVGRGNLRPGGIRLLGYLAWFTIRLALGIGGAQALTLFVDASSWWLGLLTMLAWTLVNALAYPALGCLDAVLHLENRMRVEGMDIALSRARRAGQPTAPVLAVPR